jgi:LPS-assembly protein
MSRFRHIALCCCVLVAGLAEAQEIPGFKMAKQWTLERIGEHHWRFTGDVEIEGDDTKLYADQMEFFTDTDLLVASGNVVFAQAGNRIVADRVEFSTRTRTGTFYNASGSASLAERADRSMFGTQEPDAYFYGETLEKIGPRKYRITNGGFTTCVQPTPRWELTSSTVVLNLDDYAILRNSVFKVKGVPVFYLPVFYYPIQEDDRATGFLIPSYGASTFRGHTISNAFFWAINRSQDATLFHDWFSATGQGTGGEYRYVQGPGSEGSARAYLLNERAIASPADPASGAGEILQPGRRSYEIRGGATQVLGGGWRARGRVDYFSDVTVQQLYHTNIYDASRRQRSFGGNVARSWGPYSISGTFDRNETFFGETNSALHGAGPRIYFSRNERPLPGLPVYISAGTEYANLLRSNRFGTTVQDSGLTRLDTTPTIRVPFTRWPFLTLNSSLRWRYTYWTESLDADRVQVGDGISRRYFDLQSQITGPALNRIWNTPNSRYAERFKHVVEPHLTIQRLSAIDVFDRIVQLESADWVVGNMTRLSYGMSNRLYARRLEGGPTSVAREILNIGISQSYYTDARAAQYDRQFRTSFTGTTPSNFSPVSLTARFSPTLSINGSFWAEYDTRHNAIRTMGANGTFSSGDRVQTTVGWSQRRFIADLPGFDDPSRLDHYLTAATTVRSPGNRVGGTYIFNYNILHSTFLQQRLLGYYNAQCCGFAVEYQTYNLQGLGVHAPVPEDRRFNFSFTLAGIGTFSNFFGALGGGPGRR